MPTAPANTAPPGLVRLNAMAPADAESALHTCCGSTRWAKALAAKRPFASLNDLCREADAAWFAIARADWLEAFSHHPRIGETNLNQQRFAKSAEQSAREQSGMAGASPEVRRAFLIGNAEYEKRFGHVFLICATGKTGEQMLAALRARLANDADTELRNAAREQSVIMRIRLERLVNS